MKPVRCAGRADIWRRHSAIGRTLTARAWTFTALPHLEYACASASRHSGVHTRQSRSHGVRLAAR